MTKIGRYESIAKARKEKFARDKKKFEREARQQHPLPENWNEWDNEQALLAAQRHEDMARHMLRSFDLEGARDSLRAAAKARVCAERGKAFVANRSTRNGRA